MNKEKILAIIGGIILLVCIALAGMVDSEERLYLESQPRTDLQHSMIRR